MAQTIKLKSSATPGDAPTLLQLELGEVAINTYDGKMYIKKSVAGTESIVEISGGDSGTGIIDEFLYTATAGQTAFSGNDDNSDFLSYVVGALQVFLNGILLDPETDYTATNGALITLVSAAAVNDYLQIFSFKKKISDGNVTVDSFSGNNSTTAFTLSIDPGDENNTRVFVDGVYQSKANYTVSGTTLTFSTAPPSGTAIEVESGNRSVTLPTTENLDFPDNVKLRLGTSQDLEIYHDASDSLINDNGTGSLKLQTGGSTKLEVTSTGVDVTGNIAVSGTVDGVDIAARDAVLTSTTTTAGAALPKAGGAMTGAITTNSTFDGRDVAADGAKLDGIEAGATADQTQSEINALGITATGLSGTPAISVANITTTGELRGPASLVIDPAGIGDNTGTVVIKGNLQVDGATTTINSTTLTVDDLNLTLASGAANGTAANGAGITIDGASATLTYQSTGDNWAFNKNLDVTGNIAVSGTVDGVDIAARDAVLTSTTTTAGAALPKAGGAMTGAITTNSTFDGRDVATDGTKLDGIEALADVTDATNVTAAGALMDSEVTNLAQVKAFDSSDYATAAQGTTANAALPKAGGTLTGNLSLGDNDKAIFGAGSDLQIYHDGSNSIIADVGTGHLKLLGNDMRINNADSSDSYFSATNGGSAIVYYNAAAKLATTATGVDVTGNIVVSGKSQADTYQFTQNSGAVGATEAIYRATTGTIAIKTNSAERMRIGSNGNLELAYAGATRQQADSQAFSIITPASGGGQGIAFKRLDSNNDQGLGEISWSNNTQDGQANIRVKTAGAVNSTDMHFDVNNAGTLVTAISIDGSAGGNVGIGTTSPSALLHLKSTANSAGPSLIFENTNNAQSMNIDYWNNGGAVQSRIQYAEGPASWNFIPNVSTGASALYIAYNGSVGIGTTTPVAPLQIKTATGGGDGHAFGGKDLSLTTSYGTGAQLEITLGDHQACYVKVFITGDWAGHSAMGFLGEYFIQNGADGYAEPGMIIREVENTSGIDSISSQIYDGGAYDSFQIQFKLNVPSGASTQTATGQLTYQIMGQFDAIS